MEEKYCVIFNKPDIVVVWDNACTICYYVAHFTMLGSLAMPFGMLFFGPLADIVNINSIFIGTGAVMVFLGTMYYGIREEISSIN